MHRMTRVATLIGTSTALVLSVSGCGGGDEKQAAAAGSYTFEQACTAGLAEATTVAAVASALNSGVAYKPMDRSQVDTLQYITDEAQQKPVKEAATALRDKSAAAGAALTAGRKDEAARIVAESTGPYDRLLDLCKDSGSATVSIARDLRPQLDGKPGSTPSTVTSAAASSTTSATQAPFAPTPDGARLRVGESAQVEYAAKGKAPKRFLVRVTAVEKASSKDLEAFKPDALKDVGEVYYLRYEVESTEKISATSDATATAARDIDPKFAVRTSDGSDANSLSAIGSFAPCKNGSEAGYAGMPLKNCQMVAVKNKGAGITEVGLLSLEPVGGSTARFTWTV